MKINDEEKIRMLKDFYGIIKPDGTFVRASQLHEELARDVILEDFDEATLETNNEQEGPKEFLLSKGYVWVSYKLNYIQYYKLYPENRWIERQEDRLKSMGWIITKPIIPDWVFDFFNKANEENETD